jgi:hypothetical protein
MPLPGLSSVSGKSIVVEFDGGLLSSDGGILALRELRARLSQPGAIRGSTRPADGQNRGLILSTRRGALHLSVDRTKIVHATRFVAEGN